MKLNELIDIEKLFEAGVYFGHQTRHWNPKMSKYLYGSKNKIHIIDLEKTLPLMIKAAEAIQTCAKNGGKILFVGTKDQASSIVQEAAELCAQYYVNNRWLGGLITNWATVRTSIGKLKKLTNTLDSPVANSFTKKERLNFERTRAKLYKYLAGIQNMNGNPDLVIVLDINKDQIAVKEAKKARIPIVGIVDTNCDPDQVDYVIPGNDDARKAISFYCNVFAAVILDATKQLVVKTNNTQEDKIPVIKSKQKPVETDNDKSKQTASNTDKLLTKDEVKPANIVKKPAEKKVAIDMKLIKELRFKTGAGITDVKKALEETDADIEEAILYLRKKGLASADKKSGRKASEGLIGIKADSKKAIMVEVNTETDYVAKNSQFISFVTDIASAVFDSDADIPLVLKSTYPGQENTVEQKLSEMISVIGENILISRATEINLTQKGVVGTYIHNKIENANAGKIAVLISLSTDKNEDEKIKELAKQLAMHIAAMSPAFISIADVSADVVEREKSVAAEQAKNEGKPDKIIERIVEGRLNKYYEEAVLLESNFVIDPKLKIKDVIKKVEKELSTTIKVEKFVKYVVGEKS